MSVGLFFPILQNFIIPLDIICVYFSESPVALRFEVFATSSSF